MPINTPTKKQKSGNRYTGRWLVIGWLLLNTTALLWASMTLLDSRRHYEEEAAKDTRNIATILDQSVTNQAAKIDLTLKAVVAALERQLTHHGNLVPEQFNPILESYRENLARQSIIHVSDATGAVTLRADNFNNVIPASRAGRDYFEALRRQPFLGLWVTNPFVGSVTNIPVIVFVRRYNNPDGSFAGVASIGVPVGFISDILRIPNLGPHGIAILRDAKRGLIARYPPSSVRTEIFGSATHSKELLAAINSGDMMVTYHTKASGDGTERTSTYRRLSLMPFHLVAGKGTQDYLEPWYDEVTDTSIGVVFFLIVTSLGAWLLWRTLAQTHSEAERNKLFLHNASDGIHILDFDGNVLDASDSFCWMLGYTRQEALRLNVADWEKRLNQVEIKSIVATLFNSHERSIFETRHKRKDESIIDVEVSTYPIELDGRPVLFCASRDITGRKQAETALRDSEARLRAMLENDLVGICTVKDRVFLWENQAYEKTLGYEKGELNGKPTRIIYKDEAAYLALGEKYMPAIKAGKTFRTEHEFLRKDGRMITVDLNGSCLNSETGESIWIYLDITERKTAEQLGLLRHRLADMVYSEDQQRLLQTALDMAEQLTGSRIGFFHLVEQDQEVVSLQTWSTRTLKEMCYAKGEGLHYPVSEAGVWVDCIHQRQPVIHNDYPLLPHKKGMPEGHPPLMRELTVPVFRENRIVAVIGVGNKPREYDDRDASLVSQVADMTFDFAERKQTEQKIQFMAFNDQLTGLPNRQLLADRLQQAIALAKRSNNLLAIGYLDLDGFKPVNDRYGHQAGDQLLVQLARRVQQELREGDTMARLGGDEFVVLLNGLGSIYNGEEIVQRLLQSIAQPFDVDGHRLHVSASIGVTLFPNDNSTPDTLLRHADQAMYKAKDDGKNTFRLYDPIQDEKAHAFRKTITDFEEALHQSQLVLHYQPRIDLHTGELAGVEALVRWQHPDKGLLYPAQFLPLIQGNLLEITLDEWVLKAVLEQHMAWRAQGLTVPVSVNITPQHIQQAAFPEYLAKQLSAYPEDLSRYLELEVLETSAIGDTAHVAEIMNACARLGVEFSLDDFGTGYSSLTYFHRLPISVLKIDRNFVREMLNDPRDQDIVEGVLRLAEALKRPVVAEGVESIELGLMLADLGCQYAQGYGIARPMPAEALPAWARQWQDETSWHRLNQEAKGSTVRYDLHVAIFTHRQWLKRIMDYLETGLAAERPVLDATACQFARWYHGIGAARYGTRPSYPFILAKHDAVHHLAEKLVRVAEDEGPDAVRPRLEELRALCEELISDLKRLSAE